MSVKGHSVIRIRIIQGWTLTVEREVMEAQSDRMYCSHHDVKPHYPVPPVRRNVPDRNTSKRKKRSFIEMVVAALNHGKSDIASSNLHDHGHGITESIQVSGHPIVSEHERRVEEKGPLRNQGMLLIQCKGRLLFVHLLSLLLLCRRRLERKAPVTELKERPLPSSVQGTSVTTSEGSRSLLVC
eukprot:6463634-Amphidinium_carterae.1